MLAPALQSAVTPNDAALTDTPPEAAMDGTGWSWNDT
jgi:hypothetical protein